MKVRQAINMAIDREGVLKGIFSGVGIATTQLVSPFGEIYDEKLNETYEYDPEKGKELVEEAGYAGESFQIPSTFLSTTIEPVLTQAFSDIGLTLEWVTVPPQQAQAAARSGDYGLYYQILGFNSDSADLATTIGAAGLRQPDPGYTDATLDGYFDEINNTVDFADALRSTGAERVRGGSGARRPDRIHRRDVGHGRRDHLRRQGQHALHDPTVRRHRVSDGWGWMRFAASPRTPGVS